MLLRLSDPLLAESLRDHLRRVGCVALERVPGELEVIVDAPTPGQARRELDVYVAAWRATHPLVDVLVADD
jgi:hypothetical protein